MEKPRALVWGAYGFIGRHLTRYLVNNDIETAVLTRSQSLYDTPEWAGKVESFELGDRNRTILRSAVAGRDLIFNLAGSSGAVDSNQDPMHSLDANCRVQLEFLETCAEAGHCPHVIFSSSRLVYGQTGKKLVDELHAVDPRSVYACHKLCIENYLNVYSRLKKIIYTTCRISNVYGEDDDHRGQGYRVINGFIKKALAGQPLTLFGTGDQLRDFIYVDDLVQALWRCATVPAARNQLFNVGSGRASTMKEAVELISNETGAQVQFTPWPDEYRIVESGDFIIDLSKANRLLDFTPQYGLALGIARTIVRSRNSEVPTNELLLAGERKGAASSEVTR